MIRIRKRVLTPVQLGLLIIVTMVLLSMSVSEAGAYLAPPVPYPIDAEGDGDDFYNYQMRLRGRQDGREPDVQIPEDPVIAEARPVVPNPWEDYTPGTEHNLLARFSHWVWVIQVIRGF